MFFRRAGSYTHAGVIPGKALRLNCSSSCSAESDVMWFYKANGSATSIPVPVDNDPNYALTRDNELIILTVNRSEHVGTFLCQTGEPNSVVLAQHTISLSGRLQFISLGINLYVFY